MAELYINKTIWKLFKEQNLTIEQIAASLDMSQDDVAVIVAQMPVKKDDAVTASRAKAALAEMQDALAAKIGELALGAENEAVQFHAAKFGLLLANGHYDPKENKNEKSFSPITINNYIQQATEAYKSQPGIVDVETVTKEIVAA
jgi:DNA-directed RNA polymerase specialized sigma subunit